MLIWRLFFRPSEGTIPEQAQGLFDDGASAACHPSHRFHVDGHCTVDAYRASVERSDAQLSHRALQSREGYRSVVAPREVLESNRVHERSAGTSSRIRTCFIHKISCDNLFFFLSLLVHYFTKLVLASFPSPGPTTPPHLALVMKTFQTLFPPLAPRKIALSSARRVVLVAYNAERGTVDWRHYRITVKPYGVSRRVRRALQLGGASGAGGGGATIDLGNERDVADYVLRAHGGPRSSASASASAGGYETAASEVSSAAEDEAEDVVSLAEDYVGRNNRKGQKRAVRLDEIGPRMEIRLVKITEGVPGREGAVIYHEFGTSAWFEKIARVLLNLFFFSSQEDKIGDCGSKGIARFEGKVEKGASGGARAERATQKGIGGKVQGGCS